VKNILTIGSVGAKIAIVLTATVGGVALVGSSVFASLTATANNVTPQSISSGSLALTLASDAGSAGFTSSISSMIPGDTQYRFVTYTQAAGNATALTPTLQITDAASTALTADSVRGLALTVQNCSVAWAYALGVSAAPTCGGTTTAVLGPIALANLKTANPLTNFNLTAAGVNRLVYAISMPSGVNETNSNGATAVGNSPYAITAEGASAGTVTYSTTNTTGLFVGEQITVTGATTGGFNGTFVITAVSAGASFAVTNATTGSSSTATGNLPTIQSLTSTITWTVSEAQRAGTSTNG